MKRRTEGEIKAYVDGYNACYNQFCECLKGRKSVWQAVKKMELFVTAVNSTVEVADTPQTEVAEDIVKSYGFSGESYRQAKAKTEPQTDCGWK